MSKANLKKRSYLRFGSQSMYALSRSYKDIKELV